LGSKLREVRHLRCIAYYADRRPELPQYCRLARVALHENSGIFRNAGYRRDTLSEAKNFFALMPSGRSLIFNPAEQRE